jgi:hypothetical protein
MPYTFVFLAFHKNGLIKASSSFEYLSAYKIPWAHVDWCKFCTHLRSMNIHHFGMIEARRLTL